MHVLYVEDDPLDADLTRHCLMSPELGIQLEVVSTVQEARQRLSASNDLDVLLLDLNLPDGNGLDVLTWVREQRLPLAVVVLTGSSHEQIAITCLKSGADDFVVKKDGYLEKLPAVLKEALVRYRASSARLLETIRVLYAEDNAFDVDLTRDHLARHAPYIKMDVVSSPEQVFQWLQRDSQENNCDLLLLDYNLPGMNALEILKELRDEKYRRVPVMLITGQSTEEVALQALRLGASDYVLKDSGYLQRLAALIEMNVYYARLQREQQALQESEARYRLISELTSDYLYSLKIDPAGELKLEWFTGSVKEVTGYTWEDINSISGWQTLIWEEDQKKLFDQLPRLLAGESIVVDFRLRMKTQSFRWVRNYVRPVIDAHTSQVTHLYGAVQDIHDRKLAEEELARTEALLLTAIEQSPAGILVADAPDVNIRVANLASLGIRGGSPEQLTDVPYPVHADRWQTFHLDGTPYDPSQLPLSRAILEGKVTTNEEVIIRRQDGEDRYVTANAAPVRNEQGEIVAGIVVFLDITEQKLAQKAALDSAVKIRAIFESILDGITVMDLQGQVVDMNEAAYRMMGCDSLDELLGVNAITFSTEDQRESAMQQLAHIFQQGRGGVLEYKVQTRDGRIFDAEISAVVLNDIQDQPVGLVVVTRDVSERKQHERELQAVAAVSAALRSAQSLDEMLPVILEQIAILMNVKAALIGFRDAHTGDAVVRAANGDWSHSVGWRIPAGHGISGYVMEHGQPYVTNDLPNDPHFYHKELVGDLCGLASVPLATRQGVFGWLSVAMNRAVREDDLPIVKAIADIASNAIHRAGLHEQTERRLQYLNGLRTVDQAITGSFDIQVTLDILLNQVISLLKVDAACLMRYNPYSQLLEYACGMGFRTPAITTARVRLGEAIAGRVALERRLVRLPSLEEAVLPARFSKMLHEEGFVAYLCLPLIAKGNVQGVLEVYLRSPLQPDAEWLDFLDIIARQAAIAIDNSELFENLQHSNLELALAYESTLEGWSKALDLRDEETEGHTRRVVEMTQALARTFGMPERELAHIRRGALLHDIGKMAIPDAILRKPGPLTDEEWQVMHKHPQFAYDMLSTIGYLRPALDIPYCHHEKWDGSGYPRGLAGKQIPLAARIFAVVDVWDALRSDRPYRKAWSDEQALEYIRSQAGTHFDPQVVEAFLRLV